MKMCSLRHTQILFPHLRSIKRYPELLSKELLSSLLTTVGTSLVKLDLKLLFSGEDGQPELCKRASVPSQRAFQRYGSSTLAIIPVSIALALFLKL